jgi:hypothetical protein
MAVNDKIAAGQFEEALSSLEHTKHVWELKSDSFSNEAFIQCVCERASPELLFKFIRDMSHQDGTVITIELATQLLSIFLQTARARQIDISQHEEFAGLIGHLIENQMTEDYGEDLTDAVVGYLQVFFANGLDPNTILPRQQFPLFLQAFKVRQYRIMKAIMAVPGFNMNRHLLDRINEEVSQIDEIRENMITALNPQRATGKRSRYSLEEDD